MLFCWGATCWVVVFGAPLGSLLLTPGLRAQLRVAFYLIAVAQFVGFAVLKIRGNALSWSIFAGVTVAVLALLGLHFNFSTRRLKHRGTPVETLSLGVVRYRLLTVG